MHKIDPDDEESQECGDEGHVCYACASLVVKYWAEYFGLRPEMTRAEVGAQLEQFRPISQKETE